MCFAHALIWTMVLQIFLGIDVINPPELFTLFPIYSFHLFRLDSVRKTKLKPGTEIENGCKKRIQIGHE